MKKMGYIYVHREINQLHNKTFQEYQHKIAYRTNNTIQKYCHIKQSQKINKYKNSSKCPDYSMKYVGQMGNHSIPH